MHVHVLALLAATAGADVRILTYDNPRARACDVLNFDIVDGNAFTTRTNVLLDPFNFGPAGIGGEAITFLPQVQEIEPTTLVGVDMVMISVMTEPLDACERIMLAEFVRQGGSLFYFNNNAAIDMAERFGAVASTGGGGGTLDWLPHQINEGPFGTSSGTEPMAFHRWFTDVGPGEVFAADGNGPIGVAFEHGDGRAVLFCDEEWILDFTEVGCGVSTRTPDGQIAFSNIVSWVLPLTPVDFVPPNPCAVDINQDWVRDIFDVLEFLDGFSTGEASADWNADTVIDIFDVLAFLSDFEAGCWFE